VSIIVPNYMTGDKTDCGNYTDISTVTNVQNVIQHPAVKISYICRGNHLRQSVWISTQPVSYLSYILNLSNT